MSMEDKCPFCKKKAEVRFLGDGECKHCRAVWGPNPKRLNTEKELLTKKQPPINRSI
jgi:sarcosine oxidase delta subunit